MIDARAVVVRTDGDRAWVRISDRADGCGRCDEPGGCRATRITHAFKPPAEIFSVPNSIGAGQGDSVRIRIEDGAPLRGALASYGLGAALLVVGAALGSALADAGAASADLYALGGGATGLAAACLLNRMFLRSAQWRRSLQVEIAAERDCCPPPGVSG